MLPDLEEGRSGGCYSYSKVLFHVVIAVESWLLLPDLEEARYGGFHLCCKILFYMPIAVESLLCYQILKRQELDEFIMVVRFFVKQ